MLANAKTRAWKLLAMVLLLPLAVSCSDSETTGPNSDALVGTWQVTSFQALGIDVIQAGMSMKLTLTAARTYTIEIADDAIGSCDQATSCTETGTYSSTSTRITMDPATADEVTFNYSIQGTTMTFTGDIDGTPVTLVLHRL